MTGPLQRFLNVRRDEVAPLLLSAALFFCILTALQVLRPAREALGMQRGIESIRWLFMGTLVATLFVNPLFGALVSRFRRIVFIAITYIFFAANLLIFYGLLVFTPQAVGEVTGQVFYVWMSVFNLFCSMLFWALMADRYSLEQSKRLFGVIAVGGTVGAIFGSWLAATFAERIGAPALLLIAATFLVLAVLAAWGIVRIQPEVAAVGGASTGVRGGDVIGGSPWHGFKAAFKSPYLLGISGYVLVLAIVATFIYFTRCKWSRSSVRTSTCAPACLPESICTRKPLRSFCRPSSQGT